ncbi:MAG TPA: hypothetical protein VKB93_05610 [Thermoanaerobaculia bacterium]|nr:hypothetical protein [Thermoanaerobaculia bacterium]
MKRLLLVGLLALAPVAAFGASSVLTSKGVLYSIEKTGDSRSILLTRRSGDGKALMVIPSTVDEARDDRAQLEYDRGTDRVYAFWVHEGKSSDVMMSWLGNDGEWAEAEVVSSAPALIQRDELRTAISRSASGGGRATLFHVASWVRDGEVLFGDYSLVAFEFGEHTSTYNTNFQLLDARTNPNSESDDMIVVNPFPALALAPSGDGVDIVYGYEQGTAVTRLHVTPRLEPNARAWKPLGRTVGSLPPAHFAANSVEPVKAIFARDRVVLFTEEKVFRFVVFENGSWSETRELALDDKLTGEALMNQLKRFIEEEFTPDLAVAR